MKTIWKFILKVTDYNQVNIPKGAEILSVQVQGNDPCIWAIVDPAATTEKRVFVTTGTGNPFEPIDYKFIGTYQLQGGALVFHVFEINAS